MRLIAAGIGAAVVLVLWMQFLILPQTRMAGQQGSELKGMREKVERMERDLRHLPEMDKKRAELAARYSVPVVSVPPEEQLPNLLDKIAQFARSARVRVVTLRPQQDLAKVQLGPSGYLEIPLELVATAGYHQVGRFLDQLEASDSLVRLRELEIRPTKELLDQDVKMLLLAFLAPSPEAVAAAEAAAAAAAAKPPPGRKR